MAGSKMAIGRGTDAVIMDSVISGTTPIVSQIVEIMDLDEIGLQLIVEQPVRVFYSKAGDNVVAASHTWNLVNGKFVATDASATLKVSGAVESNNNATVTIGSVTDADTIVTNGTQTNETFLEGVKFVLTPVLATGAGTWLIEGSEDYEPSGVPALNQTENTDTAHWSNITALFSPTVQAPDGASAAKSSQIVKATLPIKAIRVTFTPSAGAGRARALVNCKSYS